LLPAPISNGPLLELTVSFARSKILFALAVGALGAVACDNDPNIPTVNFALSACPTGRLAVNAPITLNFTAPVATTTVVAGNVVVANAKTGLALPGTLSQPNGTTILFTPSTPLPFQTPLRIRVQNLLGAEVATPFNVTVCEVLTQDPPITQLFWTPLPTITGGRLLGGSMYKVDSGYVASENVPIFRRTPTSWEVVFNEPYLQTSYDAAFPLRRYGFTSHFDSRANSGAGNGFVTQTRDAGVTYDTLFIQAGEAMQRLYFRQRFATDTAYFGIVGGGKFNLARFVKWRPETRSFATVQTFGNTAQVADVDVVAGDTTRAAAASNGITFANGAFFNPGRSYVSANGGATWTEIGVPATTTEVTRFGVAIRSNGDIYVTGGGGYVARLTPSGGTYTATRILQTAVVNPDPSNFQALMYTDVQFAPDDQNKGWIVGAQLVSRTGEAPRFQGLIFETVDGGQTWTRQGVRGALAFGAEFPRLNRIIAFSKSSVWLIGDGGTVLSYNP